MQKQISAIDIFDENFYLERYPEIADSGLSPFDYYMAIGWVQGHDPSPEFSTTDYLAANPDVAKANINPLQHYLENGIREGRTISSPRRNPAPGLSRGAVKGVEYDGAYAEIFDEDFYVSSYPDVAEGDMPPLEHYLSVGWLKGYDPSLEFSTSDYLAANPDVEKAKLNPLKHYVQNGRAEGRLLRPNISIPTIEPLTPRYEEKDYAEFFDRDFYVSMYSEVAEGILTPFEHYMEIGWKEGYDPSLTFSTEQYLRDHPDIAQANLNPLQHYVYFGRAEGRLIRPSSLPKGVPAVVDDYRSRQLLNASAAYFDVDHYRRECPECPDDAQLALKHYLELGWREGYDPSPDFSTAAYLKDYPDVAKAEINPLVDYVLAGKAAGRRFRSRSLIEEFPGLGFDEADLRLLADAFDVDFYRKEYPADVGDAVDPFRHYIAGGFRTNDPNSDFSTAYYYEANPDIAASNLNPFLHYLKHGRAEGRPSAGRTTKQYIYDQIRLLRTQAETPRLKETKSARSIPQNVDKILLSSHLFDVRYVAAQLGQNNEASAVVQAYLKLPETDRPNGNVLFDKAFYLRIYGTDVAEGSDPFLHFVLAGAQQSHYPSNAALQRDVHIVKTMGRFDADFYRAALNGLEGIEELPSLIEHYLLYGARVGLNPNKDFDTRLYSLLARDEIGGTCSPYVHYLLNANKNYVYGNAIAIATAALALQSMSLFDAAAYRQRHNLTADVDAAIHYLVIGVRKGAVISDAFDTGYYLSQYPDLLEAPVNPLIHYVRFGKAEGRTGVGVPVRVLTGGHDFDPERETVLVVSHEASLTGAPIVALNVARELAKKRNVICWLGKGGRLQPDFVETCVAYVVGFGGARSASEIVAAMIEGYALRFAYVNSIVSHNVIEPLLEHMVPTTLLIHEFANYVYPKGVVTRSVMLSDKTVFPARVVQASAVDEGRELKISRFPDTVITPQGHNGLADSLVLKSELDELMALLRVDDRGKTKIMFGAGSVGIRKGVDLFIQTADYLNRHDHFDWRFIWIGGGYAPKTDMGYSVYLKDQVSLSGLRDKFFFIPEQRNLDVFWEGADVFFMSSRLDPYPNVALDALNKHVPLVCFAGATGVADLADLFPFAVNRVPYLDTAAAAEAIAAVVERQVEIRAAFTERHAEMLETFSFARYVDQLGTYEADALVAKAEVRRIHEALAERSIGERSDLVAELPRFLFSNVASSEAESTSIMAKGLAAEAFAPLFSIRKGEPVRRRSNSYLDRPVLPAGPDEMTVPDPDLTLVAWLDDEVDVKAATESMKLFDGYRILIGGAQIDKIKSHLVTSDPLRLFDAADAVMFFKEVVTEVNSKFLCNISDFLVEKIRFADFIHSSRLLFPLASTFAKTASALSDVGGAAVLMPRRLYRDGAGGSDEASYRTRFSAMVRTESLAGFFSEGGGQELAGEAAEGMNILEGAFEKYCVDTRQAIYRHEQF